MTKISETERTAYSILGALKQIQGSVDFLYKLAEDKPELKKLCKQLLYKYKVLAEAFRDTVDNDSFVIQQKQQEIPDILTQDEIKALLTPSNN